MNKNFQSINGDLCTFCGTCVGICPKNSLIAKNEKILLKGDCISCGLCYDACPGMEANFIKLADIFFSEVKSNQYIGCYRSTFAACSNDEDIRKNASSGGVVTSLLLYLLDNGLIDGAVVVGSNNEKPWCYDIKIVKTREEILKSSQSKYTLVPLNTILRRISEVDGNFALVGLPCHIHGIRKLQALKWPHANKIKFLIGLFCGFNMHFSATEDLISKLDVDINKITALHYRGGDYPGGFLLKTQNGEKFLDKFYYNFLNPMYVPDRCLLCSDLFNELADVSVGDFWRKNIKGGWSSVIVRSDIGSRIFDRAVKSNYLIYENISEYDLLYSHSHLVKYKKKDLFLRLKLKKSKPMYNFCTSPLITRYEYISGFFSILAIMFFRSSLMRSIFKVIPLKYIGFVSFIINRFIRK